MPYSDTPWEEWGGSEEEYWDDASFGFDDPDSLSIWKPHDPDPWFSPTLEERNAYRAEMGRMAGVLSRQNLGGYAEAFGPSGFGASYAPPALGWTQWGSYQPRSRVGLSSWGWSYGLDDPFPILGGAIISPTIDIFTKPREQQYDEYGRALNASEYRVSSQLTTGRATVGEIMRIAGERGLSTLTSLQAAGVSAFDAQRDAERAARAAVRAQTQSFARADFGERWSWPYGLREAMAGSANIRSHGYYGVGPKDLFDQLRPLGYFTRSTSPSEDEFHPERGAWQAYGLDSLYALGWLQAPGGGFITGTNKPTKRRQLGVQRLAAPIGADALLRTGRLTGDRMLNTTAIFLDNYPFSEGSGVVDPDLATGFRDYRPRSIERPLRAGEDWDVRFNTVGQRFAPGEDVFLGEQFIEGKWQPLETLPGIPGVAQTVFGHRKTTAGYQALIERDFPFESGTAKLMHHGMKALLFQSSRIIGQMQEQVRLAQAAGVLPADVAAPRMVLPMSKDWVQTYRGMFDFLPAETLRGMGIADDVIKNQDWQAIGPGVIDKLHAYVEQRRFTFQQTHEVPVSRLGAFVNAGNAENISYFEKSGEKFARFSATHTGYAIPIAAGFRMEYPGKSPMYSPEELMQLMREFPQVAGRLLKQGNSASRIWGVAAAGAEGIVPEGAISHEDLPWVSARFGVEGSFDDEGTARTLIGNLTRVLDERKLGNAAIVGPGGALLPAPGDVLSKSIMGISGQEQSQFVSSYVQAMKLLGTGEDATDALKQFSGTLQTFTAGHNVRRQALGARLHNAIEGTFTSHMAIPDDVAVVGRDTLRTLAGIRDDDEYGAEKLAAFAEQLESQPFYALGTRRPVSDMFNQLGVPMRVITEEMARRLYDVPIENLGRSYAVSPTVAAIWRGDVDADRALLHAVSRANFETAGTVMGVNFSTSSDVLDSVRTQTLMARQVRALRAHAPDAYNAFVGRLSSEDAMQMRAGLRGGTTNESTLALSRALHGIDVDWNESAKWSSELRTGITKNNPHDYAWYADPSHGTVFTRDQMMSKFQQDAKSKMLMGRGYNRYIRGLTSMAESPEELQAAITFAANVYQKALDNQEMTKGELMLFNIMESLGPSGAMFDKFYKEEGYIRSAFAGGPAGMLGMLADSIVDTDVPASVRALLFSRDPAIQEAVMTGNAYKITGAVSGLAGGREVAGAEMFLRDPSKAGILTQMVQALHYSKGSMADANLNPAEQAYAERGQRIRSMIRVQGRAQEGGLPVGNAIGDIRNMAGLDTVSEWQRAMAARMGLGPAFFAGPEALAEMLGIPARQEGGPVDEDEPYLVGEDGPEIFIPKTAGDIAKLPKDLQTRIRNAADPRAEFQRVAEELQARVGRGAPMGSPTVPPTGDASIAHQVYEEFGGHAAFRSDIDALRIYKQNRQQGQPVVRPDRLTRRAVNEIIARGGGEASMHEWKRIMSQFGVGFQYQMEDSPTGPKPVWSHVYGGRRVPGPSSVFNMPDLTQDQTDQLMGMIGRAIGGAQIDPQTFLGAITDNFMNVLQERGEFDIQSVTALTPIFQNLLGSGDQMEIFQRMYGASNMQTRIKLMPQGLKGHARDLLFEMTQQGLSQGYTPEVMDLLEQGYQHSGIGQGLSRSVRNLMDMDISRAKPAQLWGAWEDVQKISAGLGAADDRPGALVDRFDQLKEAMTRLTKATEDRVEQGKHEANWREQYLRTPEGRQRLAGIEPFVADVQQRIRTGGELRPGDVRRLTNISEFYSSIGNEDFDARARVVDDILERQEFRGLAQLAGEGGGGGGIRGVWSRLFARGGPDGQGAPAIENMFTELTLGWTAFRARMAWNLATGAQQGWMQDFLGEESAAVGAALSGGAAPGVSGMTSNYLSAQAAIANARAQLGEGAAQVYTPLMAGLANMGTAPGLGAGLTLFGTPIGVGAVTAMGASMLGPVFPGIAAAAGPIGMAATAASGAVLGNAYLTGEAPQWVRYEPGSGPERWRKLARIGELGTAQPGGAPDWFGRLLGAAAGRLGFEAETIFTDEAIQRVAGERAAWRPGNLMYDADALRTWASGRYENRIPVESALGLAGSLFQITGRTAQEVYGGRAPDFERLMDLYARYIEGGASPSELFNSQVSAVGYAGVPLGPQTEAWMLEFAGRIPGGQRQIYEQSFQALAPLASARMRPTTFDEAQQTVYLANQTGSMARAQSMMMGFAGQGWFNQVFGTTPGSATASALGTLMAYQEPEAQDAIQQFSAIAGPSMLRSGVSPTQSLSYIVGQGLATRDNSIQVANLMVQAESVSLQTGQNIMDLFGSADALGYSTRSIADQRFGVSALGGVAGLAPASIAAGGAQARAFEQIYAVSGLSAEQRLNYNVASNLLNQVFPEGYSSHQLATAGALLGGGMSIPDVGRGFQAMAGRAGIASAMGVPSGSPFARMIDTSVVGTFGNFNLTGEQTRNLAGMLSPSMFQYMRAPQIAALAPQLGNLYTDFESGGLSLHQFGRAMESATGSTPWGFSSQRGFGPGSLTDRLGRPYGMYTGDPGSSTWTASNGGQYAPLFDLQQSAGYANLAYSSAANTIQHRQFQMRQAQMRQEWGSGPFTPLGNVQAALFPTDGSQPAEVGSGLHLGDSTIGLAQQESAIRRQMWQENIAYQQQSLGFQRQSLEIAKQEAALSRQTYTIQREHQISEREAGRGWQLRQREWASEDFSIQVERTGITQQWQMEDLQRARRFSFGRQRVELDRQIGRLEITQGWERGDQNRQRSREQEANRFQDQRYEAAVKFEQQLHELQMQRFALQEQRLALQEQMLAAQEAHLNNQAVLQEKLQKIEDERFKTQYEQTQVQLKDEETLEKLRMGARAAEMAYETARLANAETIRDAEEKFAESIEGISDGGVLDKWIAFFEAVRGGPPGHELPPTGPLDVPLPNEEGRRPASSSQAPTVGREMRIDQSTPTGKPVVVNFILDGETVMSAVVKPERLRPVVQEINRRERLR